MKKYLKPDEKITFCRADKKGSGQLGPTTLYTTVNALNKSPFYGQR